MPAYPLDVEALADRRNWMGRRPRVDHLLERVEGGCSRRQCGSTECRVSTSGRRAAVCSGPAGKAAFPGGRPHLTRLLLHGRYDSRAAKPAAGAQAHGANLSEHYGLRVRECISCGPTAICTR